MIGLLAKAMADLQVVEANLATALGNLDTLLSRVSAEQAGFLDASIASRAPTNDSRFAYLDAAVASRAATDDSRFANLNATVSGLLATDDSRLAYLNATLSSRSTLTAAQASTQIWSATDRYLTTGTGRSALLTSGSSWTVPAGVTCLVVTLVGGGGGGAGTTKTNIGLSGGSAATIHRQLLVVTAGASLSYTIGAGGIGSVSGVGGTGGNTTIGSVPVQYVANGAAGAVGGTSDGVVGWAGDTLTDIGLPGASGEYGVGGNNAVAYTTPGSPATGYGAGGGGGRGAAGGNGSPGFILIEY